MPVGLKHEYLSCAFISMLNLFLKSESTFSEYFLTVYSENSLEQLSVKNSIISAGKYESKSSSLISRKSSSIAIIVDTP